MLIMECVEQFFKGRPILKAINHTFITLIPKIPTASDLEDFRPISCVNLISKHLTKILADRLSKVSNELISPNQTTFIQGRNISDNTMLADEMLYGFCRKRTPRRCCIRWKALIFTLHAFWSSIFQPPSFP